LIIQEKNKSGRVACPRLRKCGGKPLFLTCSLFCILLLGSAPSLAQSTRKAKPKTRTAQPQANTEAKFQNFVKQADEARLAERFEDAVTLYGEALKIKPKWPDGWWYVGAIFYQKDLYPQESRRARTGKRASLGDARSVPVSNR
jgi:hypothetical protein